MNRILMIQQYADNVIKNIELDEKRKKAYVHTYGVAQCCSLVAARRGLNRELAYISGLLHDLYAYYTDSYMCHAQSGADMVRVVIRKMQIFSEDEKVIILSAIYNHSNKELIQEEYDEVLKDADILQPFLYDSTFRVFYKNAPRLKKILDEFNITSELNEYGREPLNTSENTFQRSSFADIAEALASMNVCGNKDDMNYMEIIKYYPEEAAFDELKNAWCAAFVYHCSLKAGLELPIRQPPFKYRFAGVGTWYEWGIANNFCFFEKDGFIPSRGDIVIYNNIIPLENKQKDSAWHDHIGVVLSCERDFLIVAEGNNDNKNVSGIIKRKRDNTIGCFVRIPDNYEYDGWKYDYKEYLKLRNK